MKAYEVVQGSTDLDGLRRVERPDPTPGPGQILVRVRAASLNYRDLLIVKGAYFGGPVARSTIPLSDGAGEVMAVGPGVTRFRPGDRVTGTFFLGWTDGPPSGPRATRGVPVDGMLSEYAVLDENDAVAIPESLSFEEGATLTCAGVTAWNAVVEVCAVRPGDTVLVMGTGGVSIFALQLARAAGARVIMTSSSDAKIERGRQLGASAGIHYKKNPDWEQEVLAVTGGRGVDHIIEVGGPGTVGRSMKCVAYGGKIALIGVLAGLQGDTSPHPLMVKGASLHGIFVGSRAMLERLGRAIDATGIKPVVDRVFEFDQAVDAFRYMASGAHFGKVIIRM